MKMMMKMMMAATAMLFSACGADPSALGNDNPTCVGADCESTGTDNAVMIDTPTGKARGALILGGSCTGDGDNAPCMTAYETNDAAGMYNHACLPDDPKPQCAAKDGVWGCYLLTLDQCPLTTECSADSQCWDGNTCTTDSCASDGTCRHVATIGATCSDDNMCTVGDMCAADGSCTPGETMDVSDGLYCNGMETCDPDTGDTLPGEPVVCDDDGDMCNGGYACAEGSEADMGGCVDVAPPVPPEDDGNPCTAAPVCDPATGTFSEPMLENGTSCSGGTCSTEDQCWDGQCVPTQAGYTGGNSFCAAKYAELDQSSCILPWDYCDPMGDYMSFTDIVVGPMGCVLQYKADGTPCDGQGNGMQCWRPVGSNVPECVMPPT